MKNILCILFGHSGADCYCSRCGELILPERHEWDGCRCRRCKSIRDSGHELNGCICQHCGTEFHDWVVTVSTDLIQERIGGGASYDNRSYDEWEITTKTSTCGKCGKAVQETSRVYLGQIDY